MSTCNMRTELSLSQWMMYGLKPRGKQESVGAQAGSLGYTDGRLDDGASLAASSSADVRGCYHTATCPGSI